MNREPTASLEAEERRRLAIDFVSPLPPVRSGIADYSTDLLPHLAALSDLRVMRLPEQSVAAEIERRWHPVAAERTGEAGRLPLYQMGNNRYHEGVLRLALERPGVLTLHDIVLHHLTSELELMGGRAEPYRAALTRDHGWFGVAAGRARQWGHIGNAALFLMHANRTLLRRQRGVLVHSEWAARILRWDVEEVAVRVVSMGVPLPPPADLEAGRAFREQQGLPLDRPLLGSFGFQTPIKRTDSVIRAMASAELSNAHLLVAGEVSNALDLEADARSAGVADRVHIVGFLDYEEFEAAISACDLCLNLRYPTAGETSASLLRVLAVGRPVIVSEFAQFAELPDDVVVKVPLAEDEVSLLARRVGELLGDPERLASMAHEAREYVRRRHDPGLAARGVIAACEELAELEPPGDQEPKIDSPSSLLWRRLPGRLTVDGAQLPWRQGERRRLRISLTNESFARWLPSKEDPGGVIVEFQWRGAEDFAPLFTEWLELPAELRPNETRTFVIETRRPIGSSALVIEPHLKGGAGLRALNGPVWEQQW